MDGLRARFKLRREDFSLDVDLNLPGRGVTALFGPSGSGKTTCLRLMAGLERCADGYVALGDTVWQDEQRFVPPHQRSIGVVFQEASLFPHLSVRGNLEFGWKRVAPDERRIAPEQVIAWLDLDPLLARDPASLSGGERQRVAIARALLTSPRLLLMDEPLAALDLKRKREILPYLERLHGELSLPVIYVSHAPDEVARLADHVVLLDEGHVRTSGSLSETLSRLDLSPAFADDPGIVLETVIGAHEADDLSRLDFPGGHILVSRRKEPVGTPLRCRIHARDVSLALAPPQQSSILNSVVASVLEIADTDTPGQQLVKLDASGTCLLARITRRSANALAIAPGKPVWAQIKAVALLD